MTLNVLTLSTLFPDMSRPNFGVFVERQARELASRPDADVTVIAPVGVPYWPLSLAPHYAALRALPRKERWRELTVYRPIFRILPKIGGRTNVGAMTRAILPLVRRLHAERPFDVIDASFFFPDGPVARRLSRALGIPYSVKARGADIHYWGTQPGRARASWCARPRTTPPACSPCRTRCAARWRAWASMPTRSASIIPGSISTRSN